MQDPAPVPAAAPRGWAPPAPPSSLRADAIGFEHVQNHLASNYTLSKKLIIRLSIIIHTGKADQDDPSRKRSSQ